MSVYTVVSASKKKDVPDGKYGPMQVIALGLRGANEQAVTNAEWYTKAATAVPTAGSTLEGDLESSDYGFRFKKAQQQGGFNSGPRPEDPQRAARILRQHSQDMSLQTLTLAQTLGILPPVESVNDLVSRVKLLADVYDKDANGAAS